MRNGFVQEKEISEKKYPKRFIFCIQSAYLHNSFYFIFADFGRWHLPRACWHDSKGGSTYGGWQFDLWTQTKYHDFPQQTKDCPRVDGKSAKTIEDIRELGKAISRNASWSEQVRYNFSRSYVTDIFLYQCCGINCHIWHVYVIFFSIENFDILQVYRGAYLREYRKASSALLSGGDQHI